MNPSSMNKGMTLIEIIIYAALLSVLMSGFIGYIYHAHEHALRLFHDVQDAYQA